MRCSDCKFFDPLSNWCRRRAPPHRNAHEFIIPALLQAIALAQAKIANLPLATLDEDLQNEVTEYYAPDQWPVVKEDDWCGDYQPKPKKKKG
jgi:hypothetical protein